LTEKKELNKRQITKFANKNSLMDFIDQMDTMHQTKGTYNKKILVIVNNFGDKSHKERFASFYWDLEDALFISNEISSGAFERETYGMKNGDKELVGAYSQYGGGKVSRILNIAFRDGKYYIQVALYEAKKAQNGAIFPDKSKPIDQHSIQIPRYEARKMFHHLHTYIASKLTHIVEVEESPKQQETTETATAETHDQTAFEAADEIFSQGFFE
jgi:hypothetical protein